MAWLGALVACVGMPGLPIGCDRAAVPDGSAEVSGAQPVATLPPAPAPPEPPRAPEIVIDASSVSVGHDRLATRDPGLADKIAVLLAGRPLIADSAVSFVALRNARPSAVAAAVMALRKAKAASAIVGTEARDGTTQRVPLTFPASVSACATVAWIARDAAIDVWPAGGGVARRVIKGLAGPDITLGTEAMRRQWTRCGAAELVVGADDVLPWGLVFDLAMAAVQASGPHPSVAVLVTNAVPGRRLVLE
jgi:hypothetical protein